MNFIKCLFGNTGRRLSVNEGIKLTMNAPYPHEFKCFTYGTENHKQLIDLGINSILVCDEPYMFPENQLWAHKIYAWLRGNCYRNFIYSDWDVIQTKPLPNKFDELLSKHTFLASLRQYHKPKCTWRSDHQRKTPCASFLYFGNQKVVQDIWELWEKMGKPRKEEAVLAKYTDINNELDLDYYYNVFDSHNFFYLKNESIFKENVEPLFRHYNRQEIPKFLKRLAK